jgi:hypothetical protein
MTRCGVLFGTAALLVSCHAPAFPPVTPRAGEPDAPAPALSAERPLGVQLRAILSTPDLEFDLTVVLRYAADGTLLAAGLDDLGGKLFEGTLDDRLEFTETSGSPFAGLLPIEELMTGLWILPRPLAAAAPVDTAGDGPGYLARSGSLQWLVTGPPTGPDLYRVGRDDRWLHSLRIGGWLRAPEGQLLYPSEWTWSDTRGQYEMRATVAKIQPDPRRDASGRGRP